MTITREQRKKINSTDQLERLTGLVECSESDLAQQHPIIFEMMALLGNEVIALKKEIKELRKEQYEHIHPFTLYEE